MRSELENLAFRTLQPDHYKAITSRLAEMQAEFKETIDSIKKELGAKFKTEGIEARVSARVKSAWSIATKIDRKQIALEQLSDMTPEVEALLEGLENINHPRVLVLNKIDLIAHEKLLGLSEAINARLKFEATFMRNRSAAIAAASVPKNSSSCR